MDVNAKHPWHEQLQQLDGFPLVACAGDKRPYQKAWQTKSLTPEQIIAEDCPAVGLRCGEDSGIVAIDLDGNTATELAIAAGCEPYEDGTWIRERSNAADRTMVLFAVPESFWSQLPSKKIVHVTKQGGKGEQEQVEIFWGNSCQVIVAGNHPSGVLYNWADTSPADLKPLPAEWLAFWLKLAGDQPNKTSSSVVRGDANLSDDFKPFIPCDICGRDKPDCRVSGNGELVLCKHGNTFHAPTGLQERDVIERNGKKWRFSAVVEIPNIGTFSRFILHELPKIKRRQQSQGALRQRQRVLVEPDMAMQMLPAALGDIAMNIRTQKIVTETYGELSGDDVTRLYTRLCTSDHKWLKESTADCVIELAMANQVDPVKTWLESIQAEPLCDSDWFNLDQFLLGKKDEIARTYFKRFLVSAIKRVYEPGCQVRQLPVLRGPQDLGKGKLGESIFSTQWFGTDGLSTKLNHDDVASMTRFWCFELGELDGYRKHQVPKLKNFISQSSSYCRFVYMRSHQMIKRRTVFWGTSNGIPLNDPTGSTRFVVIPVETDLPWRDVAIAREPLLARALQEYRNGARSYSTADEMAAIQERNSDHQLTEPWFDAIRCHAERIVQEGRLPVTTDGLYNAVGLTEISQRANHQAERIANVMTSIGFVQNRKAVGNGNKQRGWWPSDQPDRPKRRF